MGLSGLWQGKEFLMGFAHSKTLIIGGARSGKSSYALSLAQEELLKVPENKEKARLFVATSSPGDSDMKARIEAHRRERGPVWQTLEEEVFLAQRLRSLNEVYDIIVVDCITMWIANMMDKDRFFVDEQLSLLMDTCNGMDCPIIFVSNEVGLGIVPDNELAREFRERLGRVNQRLASFCSRVIFMVAGIPMVIKEV